MPHLTIVKMAAEQLARRSPHDRPRALGSVLREAGASCWNELTFVREDGPELLGRFWLPVPAGRSLVSARADSASQ